ncbi:hypothetical protein evm_012974 [Chilo suppressalis]|nr:hypothetical protein evm_015034 [Chilo suppressalis]RVE42353.1 hypothetical protein evm_012974 [Chilo suppressalis]
MAAKIFLLVVSAVLVQNACSQAVNYGRVGLTGAEFDVQATSSAAAGLKGYLGNGGLINSNLGLANTGASTIGLGNAGVIGAGLSGVSTGVATGPVLNIGSLSFGSSGPLVVTSISPIGPSGLAVASENVIDGTLLVSGSLPYLSAVSFEGVLPTAGSGVATCGCGNGAVGIIS